MVRQWLAAYGVPEAQWDEARRAALVWALSAARAAGAWPTSSRATGLVARQRRGMTAPLRRRRTRCWWSMPTAAAPGLRLVVGRGGRRAVRPRRALADHAPTRQGSRRAPGVPRRQGGTGRDGEWPLRRELQEELGVTIGSAHPWRVLEADYLHARVRLHVCRVFDWRGELQMASRGRRLLGRRCR